LREIDDEAGVRGLYPLMSQLRPHLESADELVERWRRQTGDGYRLIALFDGAQPLALAGFRVQENLVYGRFLYLDDLVTDADTRGHGLGERLMSYLREQARRLECRMLVLDTPLSNALGHRFYFRNGMLASSLRFRVEA
jgi:GNAT superfamily N-acetyltransferase